MAEESAATRRHVGEGYDLWEADPDEATNCLRSRGPAPLGGEGVRRVWVRLGGKCLAPEPPYLLGAPCPYLAVRGSGERKLL